MTNFILNYASLEAPPITWPPRQQLPTTCMQTNDQVHIQDYMEYVHFVGEWCRCILGTMGCSRFLIVFLHDKSLQSKTHPNPSKVKNNTIPLVSHIQACRVTKSPNDCAEGRGHSCEDT